MLAVPWVFEKTGRNRMAHDAGSASGQSSDDGRLAGETIDREWIPLIYGELRRLAEAYLTKERADHTLQPTALVHEAFVKIASQSQEHWHDTAHFQAAAARAMRQVLIDHARQRSTQKRGSGWLRISFDDALAVASQRNIDLLALDEAMNELAALDQRKCRVVEYRFFGGMTCEQAARMLSISPKTAEADWYMARAWLRRRLTETSS